MKLSRRQRRLLLVCGGLLLTLAVGMNVIAYRHARALTHFASGGEKTNRPEQLTRWEKLGVLFSGVRLPRPERRAPPDLPALKIETVRFKGARGLELEAWLIEVPLPKGIVLMFHGYGAAKDSLIEPAREFHKMGWSTLLVDCFGSGGSAGSETSIGYFEADDVAAAFAFARSKHGSRPVALFGSSMGAAAILCAVDRHKLEPAALVLECPFDSLLGTVSRRFHAMHLPAFPLAHLLVFWGGVQQGFNGFHYNPADYARAVRCPVLLMSGANDPRVPPEDTRRVFDSLAGRKTLKIFDSIGHGSCLSSNQVEWARLVDSVLNDAASQSQ